MLLENVEPELSTLNQKNDLQLDCDGGYTSLQKILKTTKFYTVNSEFCAM